MEYGQCTQRKSTRYPKLLEIITRYLVIIFSIIKSSFKVKLKYTKMLKATEQGKLKNHTDTTTAQAAIVMDDLQATLYMASKEKNWVVELNANYYLSPTIHCVYPPDLFYINNRSNWFNNYLQYPIPQK